MHHDIESGSEVLKLVRSHQNRCESETLERLPEMGAKAPACLESLGMLISLLDLLACCGWGCPGKDQSHSVQRLTGRAVSHSVAAIRLMNFGHYDEALSLARSIGETTNLLFLFSRDSAAMPRWESLQGMARWNAFRPGEVRKMLAAHGVDAPITREEYEKLSDGIAHVGPHTLPQGFNPSLMPTLGGYYQGAGFLISLNELAWPMAILGACSSALVTIPAEARQSIVACAVGVLEHVGGARFEDMDRLFSVSL